jgi:hypothetical protein
LAGKAALRIAIASIALAAVSCTEPQTTQTPTTAKSANVDADANGFTAATQATTETNAKFGAALPLDEAQDFEEAKRGLIESDKAMAIQMPNGKTWSQQTFDFVTGEPPVSVKTRVCGAKRSSTATTASFKSPTASIRCAATTFRT